MRLTRWTPLGAALLLTLTGCAGQQVDLLTYDTIVAAQVETLKGVNSMQDGLAGQLVKDREALLTDLKTWVLAAATQPDEAQANATEIAARMRTHLADYAEQEQRLRTTAATVIDNIRFTIETAEAGRKFSIYRASVAQQFKDYLNTVRRPTNAVAH